MIHTYRSQDRDRYRMAYADSFRELEPLESEVAIVDEARAALHNTITSGGAHHGQEGEAHGEEGEGHGQ